MKGLKLKERSDNYWLVEVSEGGMKFRAQVEGLAFKREEMKGSKVGSVTEKF